MKKAVVVAAGLSSRLYPLTLSIPKVLLKINGRAILKHSIHALQNLGITEIALIVGYQAELLKKSLGGGITYISNPFFKQCNMLASLWFAKDFIKCENFVYMHGDLIYDPQILKNGYLYSQKSQACIDLIIDENALIDEEALKVRMKNQRLLEATKEMPLEFAEGEWTGMAFIKDSHLLFQYAEEILMKEGLNFSDAYCFTKMAQNNIPIGCSSTNKLPWREIDFLEDYNKAQELFV